MFASVLLISCKKETDTANRLELLNTYSINVPEPSGLAINSTGNILYTVSDNTGKVYKLSITGLVLQTLNYVGNDLEGICSYKEGKLLLAEERKQNIVELTISSGAHSIHNIDYNNTGLNKGIEGVTYNPTTQVIYFINEKDPDKLFKLNKDFNIITSYNLNFANDYSGIFYDITDDLLWIVSDESQSINKCTKEGKLLESYTINVQKPEGIAIANNKIYIVSDSQEKLYIFQKPN